jgi:ABC-type transporter Mla maintaining outer membrane lipid asymmetry permease subunit MlaE
MTSRQERFVVAIGIWQVFLVGVIAALIAVGGGFTVGRPPDGSGR